MPRNEPIFQFSKNVENIFFVQNNYCLHHSTVSKYLPINVGSKLRLKMDGKNSKYSFYIEYIAMLYCKLTNLVTVQSKSHISIALEKIMSIKTSILMQFLKPYLIR
jgi:hypothetical protein